MREKKKIWRGWETGMKKGKGADRNWKEKIIVLATVFRWLLNSSFFFSSLYDFKSVLCLFYCRIASGKIYKMLTIIINIWSIDTSMSVSYIFLSLSLYIYIYPSCVIGLQTISHPLYQSISLSIYPYISLILSFLPHSLTHSHTLTLSISFLLCLSLQLF